MDVGIKVWPEGREKPIHRVTTSRENTFKDRGSAGPTKQIIDDRTT